MPIATGRNAAYGPPQVNNKYSPLANIQFGGADGAFVSRALVNRRNMLFNANLLPQQLFLATPNWANLLAAEAGHLPPIIVVSSNRSDWIAGGINAAQVSATGHGLANFPNPSDLQALQLVAGVNQSPPVYAPLRMGAAAGQPPANRNVYILVHGLEYGRYRDTLAGTGMKVVGWRFNRPPGAVHEITGFGASRYAAVEFAKNLRANVGAAPPWNYAWIFDDNVVALSSFPGYAVVEAAMVAAGNNPICAGFAGGTLAVNRPHVIHWTVNQFAHGLGAAPAGLPGVANIGLVQQAACWDIAQLANTNRNFGPVFVNSAEDLSLDYFFDTEPIPYQYYAGIGIIKEEVTYHDDTHTPLAPNQVNAARQALTGWVVGLEAAPAAPGAVPPPPTLLQPTAPGEGGPHLIPAYMTQWVLPNSMLHAQAGNVNTQNTASSHAMEQIIYRAIEASIVTAAARTQTFQLNGAGNAQVINRVDRP